MSQTHQTLCEAHDGSFLIAIDLVDIGRLLGKHVWLYPVKDFLYSVLLLCLNCVYSAADTGGSSSSADYCTVVVQ